jgi:hypothetical protein
MLSLRYTRSMPGRLLRLALLIAITVAYGLPWWQGEGVRKRSAVEGRTYVATGVPGPSPSSAPRCKDPGVFGPCSAMLPHRPALVRPPLASVVSMSAAGAARLQSISRGSLSLRAPPLA